MTDAAPQSPSAPNSPPSEISVSPASLAATMARLSADIKAEGAAAPSTGAKLRAGVWRVFGAAFGEVKDGRAAISLGRVAFAVWMAQATWQWQHLGQGQDIPPSMLTVGLVLLGYVTATKALDAAGAIFKRPEV